MAPPKPFRASDAIDLFTRICASEFDWRASALDALYARLELREDPHFDMVADARSGAGLRIVTEAPRSRQGTIVKAIETRWAGPSATHGLVDELVEAASHVHGRPQGGQAPGGGVTHTWGLPSGCTLQVSATGAEVTLRAWSPLGPLAQTHDPRRIVDLLTRAAGSFQWTRQDVPRLCEELGLRPQPDGRLTGVDLWIRPQVADGVVPPLAADGVVPALAAGWPVGSGDLDDGVCAQALFARLDEAVVATHGPAVGTVRAPFLVRRVWRLPIGHDLELTCGRESTSLIALNSAVRDQQTQPVTPERLADSSAAVAERVMRLDLGGDPEDPQRLAAAVGARSMSSAFPSYELELPDPPFQVTIVRPLPFGPFALVTVGALWAEDFPGRGVRELFDLMSTAVWRRWGVATRDDGTCRVWTLNDWTVQCLIHPDHGIVLLQVIPEGSPLLDGDDLPIDERGVHDGAEAPDSDDQDDEVNTPRHPADPLDAEVPSHGLRRSPRRHAGLPTAEFAHVLRVFRTVLGGAYRFDQQSAPMLARAIGVGHIDFALRDSDGDVRIGNQLGPNDWLLSGTADPNRFLALSVAPDAYQLGAPDFDDAVQWVSDDLFAPDERSEDESWWRFTGGGVRLGRSHGVLSLTVSPPAGRPAPSWPPVPTAEFAYALRACHDLLDGGFDFDEATLPVAARALGARNIDPHDRDEDGDIVVPNPFGAYSWALLADPDDAGLFRAISVTLSRVTFEEASDWVAGEPHQAPEPHESGEGYVRYYHTRGLLTVFEGQSGVGVSIEPYDR